MQRSSNSKPSLHQIRNPTLAFQHLTSISPPADCAHVRLVKNTERGGGNAVNTNARSKLPVNTTFGKMSSVILSSHRKSGVIRHLHLVASLPVPVLSVAFLFHDYTTRLQFVFGQRSSSGKRCLRFCQTLLTINSRTVT